MSGTYSSLLRAGGGLGATTVLAAKVAFASGALAAAAFLARAAVPQLVSGSDGFLRKLYLFATVHVMIFVILKLSDNENFHAAACKDPWAPVPHHPAPPLLSNEVFLKAMKRTVELLPAVDDVRGEEFRVPPPVSRTHEAANAARAGEDSVPPPVSRPRLEAAASPVEEGVMFVSPGSCGGESFLTTESEEETGSSAVATSAYVAAADSSGSVVPSPAPVRKRLAVERGLSVRPPPAVAATDECFDVADNDDANGNDDLDATWNAILQKNRPVTALALSSSSPPPSPSPPITREPSAGAVELYKRSEDFINQIHNSFGRQH